MEKSRAKFLRLGLILVATVILSRLFFIQIIQHGEWVAKAEEQHTLENTIQAERGEIYMMDGSEPVAVVMNETVYNLVIDPMIIDREKIKEVIDGAGIEKTAEWDEVFSNGELRYFILAKNVPREKMLKVKEAEIGGVYIKETTKRVYPEGELAAQVLGFVNADGKGQYGVEGALDEKLKGKDGLLKTIADVNNVALSIGDGNVKIPAEDGEDVVLTIDRNIQKGVEKILAEKVQELGDTGAAAIVMNPNNGEILAMANVPTYDPANYGNVESAEIYVNKTTEDPYEPASVCKSFVMAAGIEEGALTPETTFYNEHVTYIDGWPIWNATVKDSLYGTLTMQDALDWSLNTGSIQALRYIGGDATRITQKGRETLYRYYTEKFGLGRETGIELYESLGLIGDPNEGDGRDSLYANMTFGQNLQVTMVQVISAYSALINGGNYYRPTVVKGKMENGKLVEKEAEGAVRRVVSEETSKTMREMLIRTRTIQGFKTLDKAGYITGGKTGTAQVIRDGKYVLDELVATYSGFGGNSQDLSDYIIMVRIWKDGGEADGHKDALPTFIALSNFVIDYLKIKPNGN